MKEKEVKKVTIIGCGNVAHWLVYALKNANIEIGQIYSRSPKKCQNLALFEGIAIVDDLDLLRKDSDLYLFSLKDEAYAQMIQSFPFQMKLAALTAGSVSQNLLMPKAEHYGVIYPCQSIRQNSNFLTLSVPLCIEGSDPNTEKVLTDLAAKISPKVSLINEAQRTTLHRAAVFANNFTNALYQIAFDILKAAHIDKNILMPLIHHTVNQLEGMEPAEAQTGPAKRGDSVVMQQQVDALTDELEKKIYIACSQYIEEQQKKTF